MDSGLFDLKGHYVWGHIECEKSIANGEIAGTTAISNLSDWAYGDILDQERIWKE